MAQPKVLDTLAELREGLMLDELADAIQNAVTAVRASGKPSRVVLSLTVRPVKQSGGTVVAIDDDVKVKLPPLEKGGTLLFADDDGVLTRHNPKQPQLPLREVAHVSAFPMPAPAAATAAGKD